MSLAWQIVEGDCRDVLKAMPAGSVHTCVTSPPYFGLRDYGTEGQIGLEPTPDEFVAALVVVFREVRRVLRDDGTVWLNLGDSYSGPAKGNPGAKEADRGGDRSHEGVGAYGKANLPGIKSKDLIGIPWAVAFALRADGWYLRSDIIWSKPNPMPESVTDRPTKAHEYLFLLSKRPSYFYDADAIREDHSESTATRAAAGYAVGGDNAPGRGDAGPITRRFVAAGRNIRSVWTVATAPFTGAHFATFPPKLIEPCILAGAPERACGECGAPWVRVTDVERDFTDRPGHPTRYGDTPTMSAKGVGMPSIAPPNVTTLGFEPSCDCDPRVVAAPVNQARVIPNTRPGVVLDPFAGAGTTGLVALQHGREFVGIELNPEYAAMARDRIEIAIRLGFRSPQRGPDMNGHDTLFDMAGGQ